MKINTRIKAAMCLALANLYTTVYADTQQLTNSLNALEQEKNVTNIYRAYFPNETIARKTLITYHAQIHASEIAQGYLIIELTEQEKIELKKFGYQIKPATDYIEARNLRLQNTQHRLTSNTNNTLAGIPNYACYETVEESLSAARNITTNHPSLAELIDVGDSWEKTQNQGGYDIQVLKLTNSNTSDEKPVLFINSAIHAREYATAPLSLAFAQSLVNGYGSNADATWLLDHHEIHLMLQTNPDGRKQAETGLSWRKNTNQNYCGATSNSRGADLNRNFSYLWNYTNGSGSSGNVCASTYRGPSAGSEPEIKALEGYVRSIFADKRGPNLTDAAPSDTSGIHIDIHSYGELVLWPWGVTNTVAPNGKAMQTLGRKFAYFNNYHPQQSIGLYATDGTSDNVSYGELGVAAFTFELGTRFFQDCSTYENTILPDNLSALIYAAKVARTPYITPAGPDINNLTINGDSNSTTIPIGGNAPISASATDIRFSNANGTETTQNINAAEYYIDTPPWKSGANAISLAATDGSFNSKTEAVSGTISAAGLSEGRHTVYVRAKDSNNTWGAISAMFINITDAIPPNDNELENGVTKANLSGEKGTEEFYTLQVPAEATTLKFVLSGGTGDADLYVRYAEKPTQSNWECRPYKNGNEETCTINNIKAGVYHVMLRGYSAYSNTSLTGTYTTANNGDSFENTNNVDIPDNNSTGVSSSINVTRSGASGSVTVEVDIVHTYIGDLIVDLVAPDGTIKNLHNRSGGSSNNINKTYVTDFGTVESKGNWQLKVRDRANRDVGYIDRVKLTFTQ
ncbi:M14 family zinc carboxypeptidase [Aliikangiella sp. IMCC44359]|uniref:M14 family zinc carboxypeptidase n=1 Tax=Aliikangiella sp. IMCC44359 TaxID=3459125 RepID=UPI00403A9861